MDALPVVGGGTLVKKNVPRKHLIISGKEICVWIY